MVSREDRKEGLLMNSGMIGKIEKAHRYAQEPDRVRVQRF